MKNLQYIKWISEETRTCLTGRQGHISKTIYLVILVLISSCTKVIDVNLNEAAPQVAIEANLEEGTHDFNVLISETGNYFGGEPNYLSGATVTLFDGTTTTSLTDLGNGTYTLPAYTANEGVTYVLTATVNGKTYEATSIMPNKVNLDTLTYRYQAPTSFTNEGYFTLLNFQDPVEDNFYRGTVFFEGELTKGIDDLYIFDDELSNGNYTVIPVFGELYQLGDSVTVNLFSLNKEGYKYYETIDQITSSSGGGNVAPANPNNNWSNDALGHFQTYAISSFSGVVQ